MILIGVDTGGTFTDFVYKEGRTWKVLKLLSSPYNPANTVLEGKKIIAGDNEVSMVHGSTVATNAILEKKGAKTALITNKRFEDIIEIGRQNRFELYNLKYNRKPCLVDRELRFGIDCRITSDGEIEKDIDDVELSATIDKIIKSGAESVAVCLLFSFKNNKHEAIIGGYLDNSNINNSLSYEILSEFREYERTSTTVLNAYVAPKMSKYLSNINEDTKNINLRIMQSNGGVISAAVAMSQSVRTILSGPAGGVVGSFAIGKIIGNTKLITFDMGGTSTDVSLINNKLTLTTETYIDNYPVRVPMIDIHTVGAGGGSIAYLDEGGSLRVGPVSAGADPGPICYGKGDKITVTDANCFLGRLLPDYFLGGKMVLKKGIIAPYLAELASISKLNSLELAEGILDISNTVMEKAIRVITVEKGFDPSEFTLFTFGGAGPLHCAYLARLLQIPKILIPNNPGIMSAIGMILADVVKDYSKTVMFDIRDLNENILEDIYKELEHAGYNDLLKEGLKEEDIYLERYIDMRYIGQSYEIMVVFNNNYVENFHNEHERLYGYSDRDKVVELVNVRIRAIGLSEKPVFKKSKIQNSKIDKKAFVKKEKVIFDGKEYDTNIYQREQLSPGNKIDGPSIVIEYSSTTVVPPYTIATIDEFKNIVISFN